MKKSLIALLALSLALFATGCDEVNSDDVQRAQQEELSQQANSTVGMPTVKNFFEKKMARDIIELRDNPKLVTYAYTQNLDGKFVYIGQAIGFGLPYSTQYTNPQKADWNGYGSWTLPQADPNGLFGRVSDLDNASQ